MFRWLKDILGVGPSVPAAIEAAIPAPEEKPVAKATKPKTTTPKKKSATKQKKLQDEALNAMTKKELLDVAKVHGIKANASLSKSELVERVKNG